MSVSFSQTSISDLFKFIYSSFSQDAAKKGIQISLKLLSSQDVIIRADLEKVKAVLLNIVGNVVRYSNSGIIELGYHVVHFGDAGGADEIEFFVKDIGTGMPLKRHEVFLNPFDAPLNSDGSEHGGDLDVSLTKAYVNILGGKMRMEHEAGIGSVFYIDIPFNNESDDKVISQNNNSVDNVKNLKILIAEDDEISGLLLTIGVKTFGKEVLKVRNGVEAVETCLNNPDIDLVLMDIKMPELDGYEATRQIRQFNTDVVIIAQTAYALMGDREKALAAGCNDYIAKPFGNEMLGSVIRKCFLST